MEVKFNEWNCKVWLRRYANGNVRIDLIDTEDGAPIATATCNIETKLEPNEVLIKNYSENEGVLDALIEAGIVSTPIRKVPTGYVSAELCKLLIQK